VMQYTQDYDEAYPPFLISRPSSGVNTPPGGNWSDGYWFWPQTLYEYHKSVKVFKCPSTSMPQSSSVETLQSGQYGANRLVMTAAGDSRPPLRLSSIQRAADKYLIMDASYIGIVPGEIANAQGSNRYLPGFGQMGGPGGCDLTPLSYSAELTAAFKKDCESGRHFDGVNVAFADGHAKWLKNTAVYEEARKCTDCSNYATATPISLSAWNPFSD